MSGNNIEQAFGQKPFSVDNDSLSRAVGDIAEKLSYAKNLERLMQIARVTGEEKQAFAILYAINKRRLKSKVIKDYLYAYLSLSNSVKGLSREELIKVIEAGSPQFPKSMWGKMKDKIDF